MCEMAMRASWIGGNGEIWGFDRVKWGKRERRRRYMNSIEEHVGEHSRKEVQTTESSGSTDSWSASPSLFSMSASSSSSPPSSSSSSSSSSSCVSTVRNVV